MIEVLSSLLLVLMTSSKVHPHPHPQPNPHSAGMIMRYNYLAYPESDGSVYYDNDNFKENINFNRQTDIVFKPLGRDSGHRHGSEHLLSEQETDCNRKLMDSISKITEKASENIDKLEEKLTENVNKILKKLTDHIGKIEHKISDDNNKLEEKITDEVNRFEEKITDKVTHFEEKLNGEVIKIDEKVKSIKNGNAENNKDNKIYFKQTNENRDTSDNKVIDSSISFDISVGKSNNSSKNSVTKDEGISRINFIDSIDQYDVDFSSQGNENTLDSAMPEQYSSIAIDGLMEPTDEKRKGRRERAASYIESRSRQNHYGTHEGTTSFSHQTEWQIDIHKPIRQQFMQALGNEQGLYDSVQDDNHEAQQAQRRHMIVPLTETFQRQEALANHRHYGYQRQMDVKFPGQDLASSQTHINGMDYNNQKNHGAQQLSANVDFNDQRDTQDQISEGYGNQRNYGSQVKTDNIEFSSQREFGNQHQNEEVDFDSQQQIGKLNFGHQRELGGQLRIDHVDFGSKKEYDYQPETDNVGFDGQHQTGEVEFGRQSKYSGQQQIDNVEFERKTGYKPNHQTNVNQRGYNSIGQPSYQEVQFPRYLQTNDNNNKRDSSERIKTGHNQSSLLDQPLTDTVKSIPTSYQQNNNNKNVPIRLKNEEDQYESEGQTTNTHFTSLRGFSNDNVQTNAGHSQSDDSNSQIQNSRLNRQRGYYMGQQQTDGISFDNPGASHGHQVRKVHYNSFRTYSSQHKSHFPQNNNERDEQLNSQSNAEKVLLQPINPPYTNQRGPYTVERITNSQKLDHQRNIHTGQKLTDDVQFDNQRGRHIGQEQTDDVQFDSQRGINIGQQQTDDVQFDNHREMNIGQEQTDDIQFDNQREMHIGQEQTDDVQFDSQRGMNIGQEQTDDVQFDNQREMHIGQEQTGYVQFDNQRGINIGQEQTHGVQLDNQREMHIGQEQTDDVQFDSQRGMHTGQEQTGDVQFDSQRGMHTGQEQTDDVQFDSQRGINNGQEQIDDIQFDHQRGMSNGQEQIDDVQFDSPRGIYIEQKQTDNVQFGNQGGINIGQEPTYNIQLNSPRGKYTGQEQTDVQMNSQRGLYSGQEQTDDVQFDGQSPMHVGQEQIDGVQFDGQREMHTGQEQTFDVFGGQRETYAGQEQTDEMQLNGHRESFSGQTGNVQFGNQKGYYNAQNQMQERDQEPSSAHNDRQDKYAQEQTSNVQFYKPKGYVVGQQTDESVQLNNERRLYFSQGQREGIQYNNQRGISGGQVQTNYDQLDTHSNPNTGQMESQNIPTNSQRGYHSGFKLADPVRFYNQRGLSDGQQINGHSNNQNGFPTNQGRTINQHNRQYAVQRQGPLLINAGRHYSSQHQSGNVQSNYETNYQTQSQVDTLPYQRDLTLDHIEDSVHDSYHKPSGISTINANTRPSFNSNVPETISNQYSHSSRFPSNTGYSSQTKVRPDFGYLDVYKRPSEERPSTYEYLPGEQQNYNLQFSSVPYVPTQTIELTTKVNRYRKMEDLLDELERDLIRFTEGNITANTDTTVSETMNSATMTPLEAYTPYSVPTRPHFEYNSDEEEEEKTSFWSNLGKRVKNTYNKAKDKTKQVITDIKEKISS